jgi:hypothetical protein
MSCFLNCVRGRDARTRRQVALQNEVEQHIRAKFDDDDDVDYGRDHGRARGIGRLRRLSASAHGPRSNARQPSHTRMAKATATLIEAVWGLILQ